MRTSTRLSFTTSLTTVPLVALLVALLHCSSGNPDGSSCKASSDCTGGVCMTSADFPSGYCTKSCTLGDTTTCPSGSVCIDDASGTPAGSGIKSVCYQSCKVNTDCTNGYSCKEKAGQLVCKK